MLAMMPCLNEERVEKGGNIDSNVGETLSDSDNLARIPQPGVSSLASDKDSTSSNCNIDTNKECEFTLIGSPTSPNA